MPDQKIVLIGQGGWVKNLAAGLDDVGLCVGAVPLDTARQALDPRAWARVSSANVLVRVGFRPGAKTWRGRAFDLALRVFGHGAKTACYWIGSDVMRLVADQTEGLRIAGWRAPALAVDHHLAGSAPLRKELVAAGIAAPVVGFPWQTVDPPATPPPFPSQFTVLSYIPDSRADFYGGPALAAVARRFPGVRFEIMGGKGTWIVDAPPNMHFLGWVDDPALVYSRATCVVRLVEHDSIGGTAVEGLLFGRPVLYSRDLAHTRRVQANADSVSQSLAQLIDEWSSGRLEPDSIAAQWARATFDPQARFEALARHLTRIRTTQRPPRLTYMTLQATTEGQAAHAHVHEIVRGLAEGGWSARVLKPQYGQQAPTLSSRLFQFAKVQYSALIGLRQGDVFYVRSHFAALPAAIIARMMRVPVVQEVNGPHEDALVAWPALRYARVWLERANRMQMRVADAVITVTPQLVRWLRFDAGVKGAHLVSNGADVDLFMPGGRRPEGLPDSYVVFFGALAPWQGIEVALDATTSGEWPEGVALVIVGDGQLREVVERRADSDRVVYVGRRPYAEIPGIVSHSLASLLPMTATVTDRTQRSTRDHTASGLAPLKMFESMSCGVPVIASELPGMAQTIRDAGCGLLVSPGNSEDLARAVSSIVKDPNLAAQMGRSGRQSAVRHHSWSSRANDTAVVLRSVIAGAHRDGFEAAAVGSGLSGNLPEAAQCRPLITEEP